jgi:N-acetylglucosaminyldiphosphoundecaprenol N-acetyl-beta-D-mannosaminyltransferase
MTLAGTHATEQQILGVTFDLVDFQTAMQTVDQCRRIGKRMYVTITNPHSVLLCNRDPEMYRATSGAYMTLPDGVGIILAARLLGYKNHGRITGPILMLRLCDWGREYGYKHYFYGGAEGVADKLRDRLSQMFPGLQTVGTYCPSFRPLSRQEDETIVEQINSAKPDIVWVGLGAPKQEKWMAEHLGKITASAMIGVGAAFDFHSANVKWAPAWMRRLGLEWVYRLTREPKRMWRRNLDSPVFLAKVVWQRLMMALGDRPDFNSTSERTDAQDPLSDF